MRTALASKQTHHVGSNVVVDARQRRLGVFTVPRCVPAGWISLISYRHFSPNMRAVRTPDDWLGRIGIEVTQRHNASADALATAQLLMIALERARRQVTTSTGRCTSWERRSAIRVISRRRPSRVTGET
jgi:hypothetical protein